VTLPEVVTGELAGKFGEISLFNQHADFELGPTPTRTRRLRGPPYASRLLSHRRWIPHPASASRVAPATSAGPARRLPLQADQEGARTRVQLGIRHCPRPRLRLQPPLRLLLGLHVRVRLRVGP
jgi:hypothetical protein